MTTIYTNKLRTEFFYCNSTEQSIITIQIKPNGASISTIQGSFATKLILELKHDLMYNFDEQAMQVCPTSVFAEAFLEAQRQLTNSLNSINQSLYQTA
jgi:hypothetical protein